MILRAMNIRYKSGFEKSRQDSFKSFKGKFLYTNLWHRRHTVCHKQQSNQFNWSNDWAAYVPY